MMLSLRKRIIIGINITFILFMGYLAFVRLKMTTMAGAELVGLATIGIALVFNMYAVTLYTFFMMIKKVHWAIEVLFVVLLFAPILYFCF